MGLIAITSAGSVDSYNLTTENGDLCQQSKLGFGLDITANQLAYGEINPTYERPRPIQRFV